MSARVSPTLEEVIEDAVARAVRRELAGLNARYDQLVARLPARLLSIREAAEELGVCESTVWRGVKDATIPSRRVGKRVLVDMNKLASDGEAAL